MLMMENRAMHHLSIKSWLKISFCQYSVFAEVHGIKKNIIPYVFMYLCIKCMYNFCTDTICITRDLPHLKLLDERKVCFDYSCPAYLQRWAERKSLARIRQEDHTECHTRRLRTKVKEREPAIISIFADGGWGQSLFR